MRLFGRSEASSSEAPKRSTKKSPAWFQDRDFTMPCSMSEALGVFLGSGDLQGRRLFGDPVDTYNESVANGLPAGMPPLVAGIYIAKVRDDGFVIAAGNRVGTVWKCRLSLVGDNPVQGKFENIELDEDAASKHNHLVIDLINMNGILQRAVGSVGGRTGRWP